MAQIERKGKQHVLPGSAADLQELQDHVHLLHTHVDGHDILVLLGTTGVAHPGLHGDHSLGDGGWVPCTDATGIESELDGI
jgi:hypothetical protein